jgi:hypothetical protein
MINCECNAFEFSPQLWPGEHREAGFWRYPRAACLGLYVLIVDHSVHRTRHRSHHLLHHLLRMHDIQVILNILSRRRLTRIILGEGCHHQAQAQNNCTKYASHANLPERTQDVTKNSVSTVKCN